MVIFFSGGGSPWIAERFFKDSSIMLSYYTNSKDNKADSRLRKIMRAKKRKNNGKDQPRTSVS
jgi:hypothetical protein